MCLPAPADQKVSQIGKNPPKTIHREKATSADRAKSIANRRKPAKNDTRRESDRCQEQQRKDFLIYDWDFKNRERSEAC